MKEQPPLALVYENGILCLCALRLFVFRFCLFKVSCRSFSYAVHRRRDFFHLTDPGSLAAFLTLPSKLFNAGLTAFFGRFSLTNIFFRNVYLPKTFLGGLAFSNGRFDLFAPSGRTVRFLSCFSISSSHIHDGMRGAKGGIGRCRPQPQAQQRPGKMKKPIPQSETVRLPAKAGSYQKIFEKYKTAQKANSNFVHSFCVKMI